MYEFKIKQCCPSNGFTLIELLIVVAIIAILAAIAVPNFLEAQVRAKHAKVTSDMRSLATAIEAYRLDNNHYPYFFMYRWDYPPEQQPPQSEYGTLEENIGELSVITTPVAYITAIPDDPFGHKGIPQALPYDYTSFEAFAKVNFTMGDSAWNARWTLRSRGPSRVMESMVIYDSSNGSVSPGTISFSGNWAQ